MRHVTSSVWNCVMVMSIPHQGTDKLRSELLMYCNRVTFAPLRKMVSSWLKEWKISSYSLSPVARWTAFCCHTFKCWYL